MRKLQRDTIRPLSATEVTRVAGGTAPVPIDINLKTVLCRFIAPVPIPIPRPIPKPETYLGPVQYSER